VLDYAVENNNVELFKLLLSLDTLDVNARDNDGQTILMQLCKTYDVQESVSINESGTYSKSSESSDDLIYSSIPMGQFKLLTSSRPSTEQKRKQVKYNQDKLNMIYELVSNSKTDLNAVDYEGNSVGFYVYDNIQLLKKMNKLNLNLQNYFGDTILMSAVNDKLWHVVDYLLSMKANVTNKNQKGECVGDISKNNGTYTIYSNILNKYTTRTGWFS